MSNHSQYMSCESKKTHLSTYKNSKVLSFKKRKKENGNEKRNTKRNIKENRKGFEKEKRK